MPPNDHAPSAGVPTARRVFETVHLTATGLWLGLVAATGVFAALVFGAVRELDPMLEAFAAYEGSHADLLAGFVQNRVFTAVDIGQFVLACIGLASLIGLLTFGRLPLNRWSSGLRVVGFGLAMGLVSYHLLVLMPRMTENVTGYWSAAAEGDTERAAELKSAFDADHPAASNVLKGVAAALALAMVAGAYSASGGRVASRAASPEPDRRQSLEEPELARRRSRSNPRGAGA